MKKPFPHYVQLDSMDCGTTCLRMIAKHYGRSYTLQNLREWNGCGYDGQPGGFSDADNSSANNAQGYTESYGYGGGSANQPAERPSCNGGWESNGNMGCWDPVDCGFRKCE